MTEQQEQELGILGVGFVFVMLIFLVQLYKADKTAHYITNIVDSLKSLTNGLTDIVLLEPLHLM